MCGHNCYTYMVRSKNGYTEYALANSGYLSKLIQGIHPGEFRVSVFVDSYNKQMTCRDYRGVFVNLWE